MKKILLIIFSVFILPLFVAAQQNLNTFMANRYHQVGSQIIYHVNGNNTISGVGIYYLLNKQKTFSINPGLSLEYLEGGVGEFNYYSDTRAYDINGILSFKYRPNNFSYLSFNGYLGGGKSYTDWQLFSEDTIYSGKRDGIFYSACATIGLGLRIRCFDLQGEFGVSNLGPVNVRIGAAYIFPRRKYIVKPN